MPRKYAVQWLWRNDQFQWIPFDDKTAENLETGYRAKQKKVDVDKERYVDLSLSKAEVLKNFTWNKNENTDDLIGLQRRKDDETKRRAVARTVPTFFDNETFYLLSDKRSKKEKNALAEEIEMYNGLVSAKLTKKVTVIVCDAEEADSFAAELKPATESNTPIVSFKYLDDCIDQGKKLPYVNYAVAAKPKPAVSEPPKPAAKAAEKRKKEEEEEESPVPQKKQKAPPAEPPKAAPAPAPAGQADQSQAQQGQQQLSFKDCPTIRPGSSWMGTYTMLSDGATCPQILTVEKRDVQGAFNGVIQWPTLNNAKTKFKGTIKGEDVEFEEYEIIQGEDDVEVPAKYSGKIDGKGASISGSVEAADEENNATFKLDRIAAPPSKDFESLKEKKTFKGSAYIPLSFELEITKRRGGNVEGVITWQGAKKRKFRGKIEGEDLEFEEYEEDGQSLPTPLCYSGRVSLSGANTVVKGGYEQNGAKGVFEFSITK